ncbi:MAG: sulfatase-like hydrolase/transferase [Burkholderiaceae bacterium]
MSEIRNVLFIMADQLRADHLGCYGHPAIRTPIIDTLARKGVRFDNAFVNSGVCGPSRMSFYTGRYPSTHGATWNRVPLSVGEVTLGEYLFNHQRQLVLAGKTHVLPDTEGLARLHIDGGSELGHLLASGYFRELDRYDGHHPPGQESGYAAYLRAQGYVSDDPWTDFVISARDDTGRTVSGWHMRNARYPSLVSDAHSETAFMTDQAMGFMREQGDTPWVMHLSYVKPHWPYIAPAPYHNLYTADDCLPVVRSHDEKRNAHPVVAAYRQQEESVSFSSDDCIRVVRPAYQGLITQLDDHLERLFNYMEQSGLMANTLIVFTADHGDFLGDHWLGEKELFYDAAQRIPLIVVDPRPQANATRGQVVDQFVESIDILPTILDALGIEKPMHRLEGRSLMPLLHGTVADWRDCVVSELDYSYRLARQLVGKRPDNARAWSLRTTDWLYVYWQDEPEQLFNLASDPQQFHDLGRDAGTETVRHAFRERLLHWFTGLKRRTTVSDEAVEKGTNAYKRAGIFYGQW